MYTLDTNAVIYYLGEEKESYDVLSKIFSNDSNFYLSTITELELLSFKELTQSAKERIETLLKYSSFLIPVDSNIARIGASIRRDTNIETADSAIAATAIATGSTLVTRNVKDFKRIPNLQILKI